MSYESDLSKLSRSPLNIIELGLDATISPGGVERLCDGDVPYGENYWPCVTGIEWVPARAAEEGGLGLLGEVVIKCKDFDWPYGAGTYFGRLTASNKYYLNRQLKIYAGHYSLGDSFNLSNFQERRYFIKSIAGPDRNGNVKIEASDVISRLEDAQLPKVTYGNLSASITSTQTGTFNILDNEGFSSGYAIIDDEIVAYSGVSGADSIVVTARAQGGTKAEDHDADSPVRHVYFYSGNAVDCVRDIIENHTEIDHANYINDAAWDAERDTFLLSENVEVWVLEPTEANEVIHKIGQQTYTNIWWVDSEQSIELKAIGPTLSATKTWNDSQHINDGNVSIRRNQKKLLTQVWVFYGKIDQSAGNDAKNYKNAYVKFDAQAEAALGEPKVKKVYADFIPANGGGTAQKIASRLLSQNSSPLDVTLLVDARESSVKVGQSINITTDLLQGTDGLPALTNLRITEKMPLKNALYRYRGVFSGIEPGSRYAAIAPDSLAATPYTSATTEHQDAYAFLSGNSPDEMSNGNPPYLII